MAISLSKSLGRLKNPVPTERLIQCRTFMPGVEKFPKTAWRKKIHLAAIFHLILNLNLWKVENMNGLSFESDRLNSSFKFHLMHRESKFLVSFCHITGIYFFSSSCPVPIKQEMPIFFLSSFYLPQNRKYLIFLYPLDGKNILN